VGERGYPAGCSPKAPNIHIAPESPGKGNLSVGDWVYYKVQHPLQPSAMPQPVTTPTGSQEQQLSVVERWIEAMEVTAHAPHPFPE